MIAPGITNAGSAQGILPGNGRAGVWLSAARLFPDAGTTKQAKRQKLCLFTKYTAPIMQRKAHK